MNKYVIVNYTTNQIVCKKNGRHYRRPMGDKDLDIVSTTKGRASKEVEYLRENYHEDWTMVPQTEFNLAK